jgi:hypothetical protein
MAVESNPARRTYERRLLGDKPPHRPREARHLPRKTPARILKMRRSRMSKSDNVFLASTASSTSCVKTKSSSSTSATASASRRPRTFSETECPRSTGRLTAMEHDSKGNNYVEVRASSTDFVRVTAIPAADAGFREPSIRIQIRGANGQLRMGPEVPVRIWPEVLEGLTELTRESR